MLSPSGSQQVTTLEPSASFIMTPASWCHGTPWDQELSPNPDGGLARTCWMGLQVISEPTSGSTRSSRRSLDRNANIAGVRICMMSMPSPISPVCLSSRP